MRLTTKFSAFVTLLTGLTIFVTLLGCSLSFYNAIQYKFSHRVQAVADAPRDKCAHFREINGIAAAFQHLQKNYNPTASSFL